MSDHWNSIANLLGTPSLNPISKKTDSASRAPKPAPVVEAIAEEVLAPEVAPSKAKPEPSRLRSSWDAVAQFFGVAAPEPEEVSPAPRVEPIAEANKSQVSSTKRKPSMWGDEPEVAPAAEPSVEEEIGFAPVDRSENRGREPEVRRGARDRRPRNEPAAPRTPAKAFDSAPELEEPSEQPVSRGRRSAPVREDRVEPVDPERRSNRRPPRRGRVEGVEAVVPVDDVEPIRDGFDLDDDTDLNSDEPIRAVPARAAEGRRDGRGRGRGNRDGARDGERTSERGAHDRGSGDRGPSDRGPSDRGSGERVERVASDRAERGPRPERTSDRAEKSDRNERRPRSEQGRPSRDDRGPREPVSREGAGRDGGSRAPVHRDSAHRDSAHRDSGSREDRRPNAPAKPKATGFGAGLHDEEFVYDDEPVLDRDEFLPVDDEVTPVAEKSDGEKSEGRPKRRRGRGRGRRGERAPGSGEDRPVVSEDREDIDDDNSVSRHTKIPSWQEAIGALVATNMENHQRNPGQGRGQRGRGPRRDR